jgi:hypothetical protein
VKTGALPVMAWGLALVLVAVLGIVVWDLPALPADLLLGAGGAAILTGAGSWLAARTGAGGGMDTLPATSFSTVLVACGVTLAVVGLAIGQAFFWPGVGMVALGLGGLIGEHRAARRLPEGER